MAKKSSGRLVSSAGLVNYYDSESRRAFHINPMYVVAIAAAVGVFILLLDFFY